MFKKYPKIHRLGKEETEGILDGLVTVTEKVDGASTSCWLEDGVLKLASRNQEITEGFNGFIEYAKNHEGINKYLSEYPNHRLYGEWLIKHSISYKETAYKQFYLFDILVDDKFVDQVDVALVAKYYNINYPQVFGTFQNPTEEKLMEFVGKTNLGDKGEGIVLKNIDFTNKFGDMCYAKIVTQEFKEANALIFGGNNKHSETYWEFFVVNKYCTLARVQKIMNKIQPEIDQRLDLKHIPRVINTCYHDLITEEAWEISQKVVSLDFKKLKNLACKKFTQIYKDILNDNTDRVTYA